MIVLGFGMSVLRTVLQGKQAVGGERRMAEANLCRGSRSRTDVREYGFASTGEHCSVLSTVLTSMILLMMVSGYVRLEEVQKECLQAR